MPKDNRHQITYAEGGFTLRIPVRQLRRYIAWDSIDAILFNNHGSSDYSDHAQEYTIYLNRLPVVAPDEHARWINHWSYRMGFYCKHLILRINDLENRDFDSLAIEIPAHLPVVHEIDYTSPRYRAPENNQVHTDSNKNTRREYWPPKVSPEPLQLVYDRYQQSLEEVRKRYNR
ncbi:hypothetical protein [Chitinophaga nivalis]|uniref:Uncharacterized protein n=1 Tax=Chitinophaga nivalis TaxID=2991709 RepID=A0ABT3IJF5_9BACT|nr:hypothetical protein [Chitinophaga nivalis]MCW3466221.1 hypothetical protein [Chitinophaga nivalis]MCW3484088.1 hypothetical protein [Chitinophaga nivalis]